MSSKSYVFTDEISNDSGVSSDTSRESIQLPQVKGDSKDKKEESVMNISLTNEVIEEETLPDPWNITFHASSKSQRLVSRVLPPQTLVSDEFLGKKKIYGKRKLPLERLENGNHDDNDYKCSKRSKIHLESSSKISSMELIGKLIEEDLNYKAPQLGNPFQISNELEVGGQGEYPSKLLKNLKEKCNSKNTSTKLKSSEGVLIAKKNNSLKEKLDFSTAFEFDTNLNQRIQNLGKRRIPLDDTKDESPKSKKSGGLYGQFKRPKFSSITSSTSVVSSFGCSSDTFDTKVKYSLPLVSLPQKESTAFGSISGDTLVEEMDKHGKNFDKKYIIVDCRYPYEYEGGHIKGAVNFYDRDQVSNLFFPKEEDKAADIKKKVPIFYCEFSQKRGPGMASSLRSIDRKMNEYPNVSYDELYVLDRGYKKFFIEDKYHKYCEPPGYVPMREKSFASELEKFKHHHQSDHRRVKRILSLEKSSAVRSIEFKKRSFNFKSFD